jgi:hypothetical protein
LKLEINNKNSSKKYPNNWKLNDTLLNEEWVIDEIKDKIERCLEVNENKNTTYQNLWDTAKAVLRRKFIAMSTHSKKTERSPINDLILQLKLLERINETKVWFFEKIKFYRPLTNLTKMRRERTQISKVRNKKGNITTNTTEIQEIIRDYFESPYSNKFGNFEEMDKFLETYKHQN